MGKYGPFPGAKGKQLRKILEVYCGQPITDNRGRKAGKGSHLKFRSPLTGKMIIFSYKNSDDVDNGVVRKILVKELGLTEEKAREVLK